jgi:hypothetical protein
MRFSKALSVLALLVGSANSLVVAESQSATTSYNDDSWSLLQVFGLRYGCVEILEYSIQSDDTPKASEAAEMLLACQDHSSSELRTVEDLRILQQLNSELAEALEQKSARDEQNRGALGNGYDFYVPNFYLPKLTVSGSLAMYSLYGDTDGGAFYNNETREFVDNPNEAGQLITAAVIEFKTSFFKTDVMNLSLGFGNNGKDAATNLGLTFYPNDSARTGVPTFTTAGTNALTLFPNQPFFFRAGYTFNALEDVSVTIGPKLYPNDHIDVNTYANNPFTDFSSYLFANNSFIIPYALNFFGGGGGAFSWNPAKKELTLRGVYIGKSLDVPSSRGDASGEVVGDPHSASLELEYAKLNASKAYKTYAVRLQYTNSDTYDVSQNALGINAEARLSDWALFGRYGYTFAELDKNSEQGSAQDASLLLSEDLGFRAKMWTIGTGIVDLGYKNSLLAVAAGRPFDHALEATETFGPNSDKQMNYELFWRFGSKVSVTPGVSVITSAGNRAEQPTIVEGFVRAAALF